MGRDIWAQSWQSRVFLAFFSVFRPQLVKYALYHSENGLERFLQFFSSVLTTREYLYDNFESSSLLNYDAGGGVKLRNFRPF